MVAALLEYCMAPIRMAVVLILAAPGLAAAQGAPQLSLGQALRQAERHAYGNRVAEALARAADGDAARTLRAVLPSVRLEADYLRTTEPLSAFGLLLHQRLVTPAAFDPLRLNQPAAIGNFGTAIVLEQPLFSADALFGRRSAQRTAAAEHASAAWTQGGTQLDVVRAYFAAVLAEEQVGTLDSAAQVAYAHQRVAESRHRNGLATRSDALLAAVRAGAAESQLVAAQGARRLQRLQLAVVLGSPSDTTFRLPEQLPDTATIITLLSDAGTASLVARADVQAAEYRLAAASAEHQRATAGFLPTVNTFGRLEWNSSGMLFEGQHAWTAGVMLRWTPFSGGSELAGRRAAAARQQAAAAAAEAAVARGELEQAQAAIALEVAGSRMQIEGAAVAQSTEAHRIVARKYEAGLATAVELFDAAAQETAARLGFAQARYQVIVAFAERLRAAGRSLAPLADLDSREP